MQTTAHSSAKTGTPPQTGGALPRVAAANGGDTARGECATRLTKMHGRKNFAGESTRFELPVDPSRSVGFDSDSPVPFAKTVQRSGARSPMRMIDSVLVPPETPRMSPYENAMRSPS